MHFIISAFTWEEMLREELRQDALPQLAAKLGCKGVEFGPYWKDFHEELPEVKKELGKRGMLSVYACRDSILADTMEKTEEGLAALTDSLNIAYLLDASVLCVPVSAGAFDPDFIRTDWWKRAVSSLVSAAADKGIVIAVENPPHQAAGNPDFLLTLITAVASPFFRLAYNTGNWLPAGYKPEEALDLLASVVGYVQLTDMEPRHNTYQASCLGTGAVEIMGILNRLLQSGYRGPFSLLFPGGGDPEAKVRLSLKYLYGR